MKKFLSILLAVIMILTLAACGKKEETTEAPTEAPKTTEAAKTTEAPTEKPTEKPAETTPAATEPPVTEPQTTAAPSEAETTAAPTEPEPTQPVETTPEATEPAVTDPVTKLDPDAKAEDVFQAMCENMILIAKAVNNEKDCEPIQLSFSGTGAGQLLLVFSFYGQSGEIPLKVSGNAEGIIDSQKGIYLEARYSENLSSMMTTLMGEETEENSDTIRMYRDIETGRSYRMTESEGQWYYSELEESNEELDYSTEGLTLETLFESYTFTVGEDHYIFEGSPKMESIAGEGNGLDSISDYLQVPLVLTLKLYADAEMRLTGFVLAIDDADLDLSDAFMEGFSGKLEGVGATVNIVYEDVDYRLPDEVRDGAVELPVEEPEDETHPWADNVFVTDNEILADNEFYTLKVVKIEDDWFGPNVTYFFENKTDSSLYLNFDALSVNGYACSTYVGNVVEPKETLEFSDDISENDLMRIGVKSIDEIRIRFTVTDETNWKDIATETAVFYPTGLTAEEIVYPERRTVENEYTVFENEQIKVIGLETSYNDFFGYVVQVYIENNSDSDVTFELEDIKINGIPYETLARETVASGFKGYYEENFSIDYIGVETVEKLEGLLLLKDPNDFWADPMESVSFSYEP